MTHRENIIAVLNGEKPPVIPCFEESPMDATVFSDLLPSATGDAVQDAIHFAEFFDNSCLSAGTTHIKSKTISKDDTHHRYRYETGAQWLESYKPTFFREAISYPVNSPREALDFEMPDPEDPARLDEKALTRRIRAFHEAGYFVQASTIGAWAGIYYFCTSFQNILAWMAGEPEAAHALFDKTRRFSIAFAGRLLTCGVDAVTAASDLGSADALLFSPSMFREYVFPWLKEAANLCHEYGAYFHLHSHGHIQDVMDGIVEAGVDIINPVGPSGNNDLAFFKRRWGDRITLNGGIGTAIAAMPEEQIRRHISGVIEVGRKGGRFFPRTESGIPPMPRDKALFYINTLREERLRGYE